MTNLYSPTWFELFLETRPFTGQELAFITRNLPDPPYHKVLDLCCGQGRHTNPLAQMGYEMTGLDRDAAALAVARQHALVQSGVNTQEVDILRRPTVCQLAGIRTRRSPRAYRYLRRRVLARYIHEDMAHLDRLPETFDAILSIWASFGYFDEAGNAALLAQISQKLRPTGRLILDIYNPAYWQEHQGARTIERKGVTVRVENRVEGSRLTSRLDYGEGRSDTFEWQLYTPKEIQSLARQVRLNTLLLCADYDEHQPVTADKPAMQLVFEQEWE